MCYRSRRSSGRVTEEKCYRTHISSGRVGSAIPLLVPDPGHFYRTNKTPSRGLNCVTELTKARVGLPEVLQNPQKFGYGQNSGKYQVWFCGAYII